MQTKMWGKINIAEIVATNGVASGLLTVTYCNADAATCANILSKSGNFTHFLPNLDNVYFEGISNNNDKHYVTHKL